MCLVPRGETGRVHVACAHPQTDSSVTTLLELHPAAELGEGPTPDLHEVLADVCWD